uniref:Uncharacterized protein n=1 Tax=Tanacetum cinerariifolium TaxID=118510 RepID=A0A6L2JHV8_TANCI|nr:hypothetical protein [Tanacetum cinerariifolium]
MKYPVFSFVPKKRCKKHCEASLPIERSSVTIVYKLSNSTHPFVSRFAGEKVMDFVNELGYLEEIHFVSKMHVNNLYHSWRDIMTLINQCLTGKTSSGDKPKHLVLQMLWGIVTRLNVDYAELLWEEFVQAIQTFFSHRADLSIPSRTQLLTSSLLPVHKAYNILFGK